MRAFAATLLALAVGCGGGGMTTGTAQLAGVVYEVDGQSASLGGVRVTLLETGASAWTDASGTFAFDGLRGGTYTLSFDTSLMAAALQEAGGEDAAGEDGKDGDDDAADDDGDDGDAASDADDDGDEFEDGDGNPKVDVPEGGSAECDVALEDGKVKDFHSDHDDEAFAMSKLHLTDAAEIAGYHVGGAVKVSASGDHTIFKVCVEGLDAGDEIEVFLGEDATSIGTATANEDGRACLVYENSIPLGAPNLGELAGMLVQVFLSGTDLKLLVGEVPGFHKEHDGEDHDGEDEAGEHGGDHDGEAGEHDDDGEHDGMDGNDEGEKDGGDASEGGDEPDEDAAGDDGEGTDGEGTGDNSEGSDGAK